MEIRITSKGNKTQQGDNINGCLCKHKGKIQPTPEEDTKCVPKTYSNRYGALFLFANTYHSWTERKQPRKMNLTRDLKTLRNFRSLILQFGVDDTAFLKGVTDIIRKDSSSNRPQNGLTLSSNKTWEPDKWTNPNEISKSLLNRYFYSVLPAVHHKMANGLSNNSDETESRNSNKYRRLSLHLNKISLKKHRSKGNIFPPIQQDTNTIHAYNNHNITYSDTQTQARSHSDHAKISYSTFDFSTTSSNNTNHNNKIYKNRIGHETLITTHEQEKTKPQQSFNIDTREEKVKSKTCPNTPRSNHRSQNNAPTLNHIDVKFLQNRHKQKSAKSVTTPYYLTDNSHKQYFAEDEYIQTSEPRFAYRANALSTNKNPVSKPQTPELITKDKVITRNRNLSVCGNSLPSIFNSSNSYVSKQDLDILELESPIMSPSPRSKYQSIDSGWESMDQSMELEQNNGVISDIPKEITDPSNDCNETSSHNNEVQLDKDAHLPDIKSNNNFGDENKNYTSKSQNIDEKSSRLPPITKARNVYQDSIHRFSPPSDINDNDILNAEDLSGECSKVTEHPDSQSNRAEDLLNTVDQTNEFLPTIKGKPNNDQSRTKSLENADIFDLTDEDVPNITNHKEDNAQRNDTFILPTLSTDVKVQSKVLKGTTTSSEIKVGNKQSLSNQPADKNSPPMNKLTGQGNDNNVVKTGITTNEMDKGIDIASAETKDPKPKKHKTKTNNTKEKTKSKTKMKNKAASIKKAKHSSKQSSQNFDINYLLNETQTKPDVQIFNKKKTNKNKSANKKKQPLTKFAVQPIDTTGPFRNAQLEENSLLSDGSTLKKPNAEHNFSQNNARLDLRTINDSDKENIPLVSGSENVSNDIKAEKTDPPLDLSNDDQDITDGIQRSNTNRNSALERRKNAALERRAKMEAKRLEQERLKQKQMMLAIEEEKRRELLEEELRREGEERAAAKRRALEEQEFLRQAELLDRERAEMKRRMADEKEKAERERLLHRMSLLLAEREAEQQLKLAKEKLEREIDEALRRKEEEILAEMEESERLKYLAEQEALERERLHEKEQRRKQLELQRIAVENERQLKIKELELLHHKMLSQKYINSSFQRGNDLLVLSQRVTRAFAYSYFHKLPFFVPPSNGAETPRQSSGYRVQTLPSLTELMDEIENLDNDG
ncbi:calponin homology domain-containing protein DDB_G0272472-like [Clytia hemisphaerica]|uniref:Uncharacterized protein n=1 Tax=Clytia hemisphaerica TaxID=252671 RepID=A0A7M5X280_9CNID